MLVPIDYWRNPMRNGGSHMLGRLEHTRTPNILPAKADTQVTDEEGPGRWRLTPRSAQGSARRLSLMRCLVGPIFAGMTPAEREATTTPRRPADGGRGLQRQVRT
ncbi:MAG: hypothetical protein J2P50_02955 [Hyphomicrobiaceae bacterium]|nr:hypothetical protein [Hyphomicrobiaceae bacterium]